MADDTSDETNAAFVEIDGQMSEDRAALLAAVARATDSDDASETGGGIPTGRLRERVGIPSGSMPYHMAALEEWGLVEVVGREPEGGGSPSKVFAVTDRGRDYLDRPSTRQFPTADEVAELRERVAVLEDEVETRQQEVVALVRLLEQELDGDVVERIHAAGAGGAE